MAVSRPEKSEEGVTEPKAKENARLTVEMFKEYPNGFYIHEPEES